ncbi:MAG: response regulator, partial [Hungatella sp.]
MLYKVIIADDEDYIRELVAKMLNQKERLEVVGIAEDGAEALDLVRKLKPDILISDICMPLLNGLDLIYQIKSLDFPLKT